MIYYFTYFFKKIRSKMQTVINNYYNEYNMKLLITNFHFGSIKNYANIIREMHSNLNSYQNLNTTPNSN